MDPWFRALRIGDRCRLAEVDYRVAGIASHLEPDSSYRSAWLLVPMGETADDAVRTRSARWLGWKDGIGGTLRTQIDPPEHIAEADADLVRHRLRNYLRVAGDSFVVGSLEGETGDDRRSGEHFEFAEFADRAARVSAEWNARGLRAFHAQDIEPERVREAFLAGGVNLEARTKPRVHLATPAAIDDARASGVFASLGWRLWFALGVLGIAFVIVLADQT